MNTSSLCSGCGQPLHWSPDEGFHDPCGPGELICFNDDCSWEDPQELEDDYDAMMEAEPTLWGTQPEEGDLDDCDDRDSQ